MKLRWKEGDQVHHATYGDGTIVEIDAEELASSRSIRVQFGKKKRWVSAFRCSDKGAAPPLPACCAGMRSHPVVNLRVHGHEMEKKRADDPELRVSWELRSMDVWRAAHFCPYCGEKLPRLRLKAQLPEPLRIMGDYGCGNCGERWGDCTCNPIESAWECVED